jgi:hypothetical protein
LLLRRTARWTPRPPASPPAGPLGTTDPHPIAAINVIIVASSQRAFSH